LVLSRPPAMKLSILSAALLGGASSVFASNHQHANSTNSQDDVLPGSYIVEFEDNYDASEFYSTLGRDRVNCSHRMNMTYTLFKGTSFTLHDHESTHKDTLATIKANPKVRQIWPVRRIGLPDSKLHWTASNSSSIPKHLGSAKRGSTNDTFPPHVMTQVDKLKAEGYTGKGIKIAMVDSGVDYTNPALGGCFGPGCIISGGWDFVGNNYTGANTPEPGPDPMDCVGHGTHVAGIMAAQKNPWNFEGNAPGVTISIYKVFGCTGTVSTDILIASFNKAYEDGADIISASIGGDSGWPEDPWSVAAARIVEAGTPITMAAGNNGPSGLFFTSSASNGKGVAAVGSVQSYTSPYLAKEGNFTVGNSSVQSFGMIPGTPPLPKLTKTLFAPELYNSSIDGCVAIPDDYPDLSSHIILVRETDGIPCSTYTQAMNYIAKGALYYLVYSDAPGGADEQYVEGSGGLGVATVTLEQGTEWIKTLKSGKTITINTVNDTDASEILIWSAETVSGGYANYFTSWGPTYDVDVKPQAAAVGGRILSTWLMSQGGYAVESGTSMACPQLASIYALYMEATGIKDPKTILNAVSATANPNVFFNNSVAFDMLAPVPQQGAGLVQAYNAVHSKTQLSVSSLSFNDTDHFISNATFTIKNIGSEAITYNLGYVSAMTMYTFTNSSLFPSTYPNPIVDSWATLTFAQDKITVAPGAEEEVHLVVEPPEDVIAHLLPVYSGYITLNATNGEALSVPYMGVVGSMYKDPTILDPNWVYDSAYSDNTLTPIPNNATFTIAVPDASTPDAVTVKSIDYPAAVMQLNMGTALLRCDIIPMFETNLTIIDVFGDKTVGSLGGFPIPWSPRKYYVNGFTGMTNEGVILPAGLYKFVVRALKIFGNESNADDYETIYTNVWGIRYKS
ncbi:hypothetical protein TD95_005131, partial [Thielaviopsis punctulata]